MNKLPAFPKEDHEKRQLEEIAHLYFSTPAPSSERPDTSEQPKRRQRRPLNAFSPFPRALIVRCLAGEPESGLSTWLLFNLAVMLKILNGPVLLIGSERACEMRFLFGFRPDRERLKINDGPRIPSGNFGPMGVCLLDARLLWRGLGDERMTYAVDPMTAQMVAFRYILSDEVRTGGLVRSIPCFTVLLVTPATLTRDLLSRESEEAEAFWDSLTNVGIVVAGASCTEEGNALYGYWRDNLEERCERDLVVENLGMLPDEALPPVPGRGFHRKEGVLTDGLVGEVSVSDVGILDSPLGAAAGFCRTTATLIRKKRSEMISRLAQ